MTEKNVYTQEQLDKLQRKVEEAQKNLDVTVNNTQKVKPNNTLYGDIRKKWSNVNIQ